MKLDIKKKTNAKGIVLTNLISKTLLTALGLIIQGHLIIEIGVLEIALDLDI